MKLSRDSWLGIGVLLALILVSSAAALQKNEESVIPYLSTSSRPDGTRALKLWLNKLGYRSTETPTTDFIPDRDINAIFVLQPIVVISAGEWRILDEWLEQGGVLVLAGDNTQSNNAMEHFKFSTVYIQEQVIDLSVASPTLNSPSLVSKVAVKTSLGISTTRADFIPLISANGIPVIISFELGKGRVILSSTPYLFSNLALKDDTVSPLVLNILALSGPKGKIWFDEWHHGLQSESIAGPSQWLRFTPGGRAILFVVVVIFLALLLQGRAFGRPVPLANEVRRRGPLEHVTAIANLNRKAGHRNEVLRQYHQRVKRHFGQRYRLDPSLNDTDYANLLAQYNSSIDRDSLLNLLKRLSQKNISETELLKLASEAARWIHD